MRTKVWDNVVVFTTSDIAIFEIRAGPILNLHAKHFYDAQKKSHLFSVLGDWIKNKSR